MKNYLPTSSGLPDESTKPSNFGMIALILFIILSLSASAFAHANPQKEDKEMILDICIDMVCIGYDIGEIICTGGSRGWLALAADAGCAASPGATGGGAAVRAGKTGLKKLTADRALNMARYFRRPGVKTGKFKLSWNSVKKGIDHVVDRHCGSIRRVGRFQGQFYAKGRDQILSVIKEAFKRRIINPNNCHTFIRENGFDMVIHMGKDIGKGSNGRKAQSILVHYNPFAPAGKSAFTAYPVTDNDILHFIIKA